MQVFDPQVLTEILQELLDQLPDPRVHVPRLAARRPRAVQHTSSRLPSP
jgi:hypothetical protein